MKTELSNKIANMGFFCACLVVIIHIPASPLTAFVRDNISIVAVPVFFVISGFLLGRHFNSDEWYQQALRRRIKTLVVPFFLLNLIWLPLKFGIHWCGVQYFGANASMRCMDISFYNVIHGLGLLPWGGNVVPGLWYVRILFYLILVSPLFAAIVKHRSLFFASLFVLLSVWSWQYFAFGGVGVMAFEFCARCPLFFLIGTWLARYENIYMPMWIRVLALVLLIPMQVSWVIIRRLINGTGIIVYTPLLFAVIIVTSLALWSVMPCSRWPKILTRNAFPLFVFHGIFLYLLPIPFKAFGVWNIDRIVAGVPIFVIVTLVSIAFTELIRKVCPKFAEILLGGR